MYGLTILGIGLDSGRGYKGFIIKVYEGVFIKLGFGFQKSKNFESWREKFFEGIGPFLEFNKGLL